MANNYYIVFIMILDDIIASKTVEIEKKDRESDISDFFELIDDACPARDFRGAILKPISLIAEVKKASPSAGVIREDFDPLDTAIKYEAAGASAVSVLTDEKFFGGSIEDLDVVSKNIGIPVLRKDFIIDEYQIFEARAHGADAVLLIAAVLSDDQLDSFYNIASDLGMACLIEVHTEEELGKVLSVFGVSGRRKIFDKLIIGINNRDLNTFKVDINTTIKLIKLIPKNKGIVVVSESGIKDADDIRRLKGSGINAVLIGEALMRSEDVELMVKELIP